MSLWLDEEELFKLTGKRQRAKQVEVLSSLKPAVTFRVRPEDSFPLVDRAQFDGNGLTQRRQKREPDFSAVSRGH